jgi:hypothetical protein
MSDSFWRSPCASLFAGLLVVSVLAMPAPVRAQTEQQKFAFGTHALRRMLYESKFKALDSWDDLDKVPDQTLLVLLGQVRGDLNRLRGLENFLRQGGAVLLATDQAIPLNSEAGQALKRLTGTVVSGFAVSASPPAKPSRFDLVRATRVDAKAIYRNQPECIIVTPTLQGLPLFIQRTAGLSAESGVATNRSSYLLNLPLTENTQRVAEFPRGCRYDSRVGPPYLLLWDEPPPFAVRFDAGDGRLLLLADHSIFINEMMLKQDTFNVDFAYNALDWLKGDNKERNRVLFVYDGQIETKLDVPIHENKISLLDAQAYLVNYANEAMKEIEAKKPWQGANQETRRAIGLAAARALFGGQAPWFGFDRLLILLGVLGAFFYGLSRLLRGSFRAEPHVPLFATAASRHAPSPSALLQRYRHAIQEDNLGDYAHVLAQDWLGTVYTGEGPPRLVEGNGWHGRSLHKLVGRIWRMAQADVPERMSQREFRNFLADLEHLRKALAAGALRLE